MSQVERVIVVEGFFDRAFVKGVLTRLGCESLFRPGTPVKDPWGSNVTGGVYAFSTASNAFIRVVPVNGPNLDRRVKVLSEGAKTKPIEHLLVIPDADTQSGQDWKGAVDSKRQNLKNLGAQIPRLDVGVWATDDGDASLPQQQALERLVVASIAAAYPARWSHAAGFLDQRPDRPSSTGREGAMALMAGWWSDRFSEGFYSAVWEDEEITTQLIKRLQAAQTWEPFVKIAQ